MSWWWDRQPGGDEPRPGAWRSSRRSVYEQRYQHPAPDDPDEHWTPVGEFDPRSGRFLPASPDWTRRVGGWQPLDEWLRERR